MTHGTTSYSYDANGNLTTMPKVNHWSTTQTVTWDAWNRPITVVEGATTLGTYQYDGLNRRIWKRGEEEGVTVERHYYYSNQWQILEERVDSSTAAHSQLIWGTRYEDDLVLRDRLLPTTERFYSLGDYFQPTAIADTSGVVQERYVYRAFGDASYYNGSFVAQADSTYFWSFLYGSYYLDRQTLLYQMRNRYYHTALGRWLSRDPLSNAELSQGANLYWYVSNNAVNQVDPSGLGALVQRQCCVDEAKALYTAAQQLLNAVASAAQLFPAPGMGGSEPPSAGEVTGKEAVKTLADMAGAEGTGGGLTAIEIVTDLPGYINGLTIKSDAEAVQSAQTAYNKCMKFWQNDPCCLFSAAQSEAQKANTLIQRASDLFSATPGSTQSERAMKGYPYYPKT